MKMKTNTQLNILIQELKKQANKENVNLWKRVASDLEKPTRQRRIVNLSKIDNLTKENEVVVVPGKVLANGELNHKVTIAAYQFSSQAKDKIQGAKSEIFSLEEFLKNNPKGKNVRILG